MNDISRRRTFAIISHPDAGKTTLTEKLLLYGGALRLAGAVTARRDQTATASDWMELEKKRGISVSSTVLQFDYDGYRINLLDTPGHRDFSEDTYRVLTAVDAVVMVIDAAKGIESQTRKLFEVCRQRRVPIFTFMNKLDRPTKDPLELIDELEKTLHLRPFPMNWPLGTGTDFRGVYDRTTRHVHLFERTPGGSYRASEAVHDPLDPFIAQCLDPMSYTRFIEETSLLDAIVPPFDRAAVLAGDMTPVFFGSASNNFGVQLLLDGFLAHSPAPVARRGPQGMVSPDDPSFSGFVFKIQGNMDPRHRDRVAFMRVCSGRFVRDMSAFHSGTGKRVKLSNSHKLFGRDREVVEEARAGDIVGLVGQALPALPVRCGLDRAEDEIPIFGEGVGRPWQLADIEADHANPEHALVVRGEPRGELALPVGRAQRRRRQREDRDEHRGQPVAHLDVRDVGASQIRHQIGQDDPPRSPNPLPAMNARRPRARAHDGD